MTNRIRHHSVKLDEAKKYKNDKLHQYHYNDIPHGISIVKPNMKFALASTKKLLSLGGNSKIGITRTTKKSSSKKVNKAKSAMSQYNNRKIRHHWTKAEHSARRSK